MEKPRADHPSGRGFQLLVVDDEPGLRELVRLAMEARGWRVVEAATAEGASQAMAVALPDVVVLDLKLPGTDGACWLRDLRRQGFRMPVLIISGADEAPGDVAGLQASFLAKPFRVADLVQLLEAAVAPKG